MNFSKRNKNILLKTQREKGERENERDFLFLQFSPSKKVQIIQVLVK